MFRTLINKLTRPDTPPAGPRIPRPLAPVCVIGDVHGRADLLETMLERIGAEPEAEHCRVITVGDMVDRGPDSARVLQTLQSAQHAYPEQMICLLGNHERMMLDFLIDPNAHTMRWLKVGGAATLRSFGIAPPETLELDAEQLDALRMQLANAIGPDLLNWVDTRPLIWSEADLAVTHAGADPFHPIERQNPDALLWGHPRFGTASRRDGIWVTHGHWVVAEPFVDHGRIAIDTGAYKSGRLSAAWFDRNGLKFLTIRG